MASPDLSVVCKNCGSEVSPYVTECPYCGQRVRKRAPKLGRLGEEPKEPRRRRPRLPRPSRTTIPGVRVDSAWPWATIATLAASATLVLIARASPSLTFFDLGALLGPVGSEWWRYLAAPFTYPDLGYLFVAGLAIGIFAFSLEERIGSAQTALLILACGALGMLAADGIESALAGSGPSTVAAAGGNGIALGLLATWFLLDRAERRRFGDEESDLIGVAVIAVVLLVLPVVNDWANFWSGLGGGVVGAACGQAAAISRAPR